MDEQPTYKNVNQEFVAFLPYFNIVFVVAVVAILLCSGWLPKRWIRKCS